MIYKNRAASCSKRCFYVQRHYSRAKTSTVDALLRANEQTVILEDHAIARVDVSQLAANRPPEDFFSAAKCLSSNAHFFGVFDGHGGAGAARQISSRLFDYMCAAVLQKHTVADIPLNERLQWLFASADHRLPSFVRDKHNMNVQEFYDRVKKDSTTTVRKAIQDAFNSLDRDISNGALPDSRGRVCRLSANIASSGSCAVVSHIRRNHLHVANVGDSAAILGFTSGRLLGELYPLRAFSDVRYKWTSDVQRVVLEPLGLGTPPPHLYTPPYLTANPEVFYHRLTTNDKFMVLASDGLWDWLEPETVIRLVADHASGAQTLSLYEPPVERNLNEILSDLEKRKMGESKKPLDDNAATHVIRMALGGSNSGLEKQYERLQEILQNYRDDITVIVITFNTEFLASTATGDEQN
ncbi:[Pyruvate dehydrogenase [acetyl-transferring]]-phosphatase 1, mitochondrial [Aphelenchoides bicaudatus]|nr:[Pyruvate dehydrogenase [acetyl-transferring]]-phosphatase 1, mitochondrial [Aphelenchoides bicaudatus]